MLVVEQVRQEELQGRQVLAIRYEPGLQTIGKQVFERRLNPAGHEEQEEAVFEVQVAQEGWHAWQENPERAVPGMQVRHWLPGALQEAQGDVQVTQMVPLKKVPGEHWRQLVPVRL